MENTICVIEDNMPIRKLFSTLLSKNGFQVVDFGDGATSLAWLKENMPNAILCDILLPDMNGSDILNFVRSKPDGAKVPIIAATGFAKINDREKYLEMGFDGYISKPINTATFVQEIKEYIEAKRS